MQSESQPRRRSFSWGNGPSTAERSDVVSNEDLNPAHWWLMS
jgi:hypothetical protein